MKLYYTFGKYLTLGMGNDVSKHFAYDIKNLIYKDHLLIPSLRDPGILQDFIDVCVEKADKKWYINGDGSWAYESIELDPERESVQYRLGAILCPDGALREVSALKFDSSKNNSLGFISRRMFVNPGVVSISNMYSDDGYNSIIPLFDGLDETMASCKFVAGILRKCHSGTGMTFIVNMDDLSKYMRGEIEYKDVEVCNYSQEMSDSGKTTVVDISNKTKDKPIVIPGRKRKPSIIGHSKVA